METHAAVRDILRAEGLEGKAGTISRHTSVADVIAAFEEPSSRRRPVAGPGA